MLDMPQHVYDIIRNVIFQRLDITNDTQYTKSCLQFVFMDTSTYEETRLRREESWAKYLKEGSNVDLLSWNGNVISVETPKSVSALLSVSALTSEDEYRVYG